MRALVILGVLAFACIPAPSPRPMPPDADASAPPTLDAAPPPLPRADAAVPIPICGQACAVLQWLGCKEGDPTPLGESCQTICSNVEAFPNLRLPTTCIALARSIDDARKCGVRCVAR